MNTILLPTDISFEKGNEPNETIVTIQALDHGYGTTIGNTLRRVMLSSLEGTAVTAVKIKGVQHEFSTLDGIKEDVLEIILNLKKLVVAMHSDEAQKLTLSVSGKEGVITAADFDKNAEVDIINNDLVIATVTDKKLSLEMEVTIEKGRGYLPTEEMDTTENEIGLIAVDAMFSPVAKVGMKVEDTRVGEITNYDKLIMNIETDGSVSAEDVIARSTEIIMQHFSWLKDELAKK
jgi:DNA-directed RNA polymerase subunit alpha